MKFKYLTLSNIKSFVIIITITLAIIFIFTQFTSQFYDMTTSPVAQLLTYTRASYTGNVSNVTDTCDPHNFTRQTKSALSYVKTEDCRNQIKDFACRHAQNKVFPAELPRFCPTEVIRSFGCYVDNNNRVLDKTNTKFPTTNSVDFCIHNCFHLGHLFAGVVYGKHCKCGNTIKNGSRKANMSDCEQYVCPGNNSEFCGGNWRILVFSTGIPDYQVNLIMPNQINETQQPVVRIVFLLVVSGRRNLRQIVRLINNIYSPNHYYYIHVDTADRYLYRELIKLESYTTNIRLKRNRFRSIWAGSTMLQVMLDSFKDLFEVFDDWKWDFHINLSESDLPLFPIEQFERFLSVNRQWNFAGKTEFSGLQIKARKGVEVIFYECEEQNWMLGHKNFPKNLQLAADIDWFVFRRDFLHYVTYSTDALIEGLKLYYRYSSIPLESFFHSVLANSKFCNTQAAQNLKLISWELYGQACVCKARWCTCSPRAYTKLQVEKFNYTQELKNLHFFVRKFDSTVDQTAIDLVESKLQPYSSNCSYNISKQNSQNYWFNDYHYLDPLIVTDLPKLTLLRGLLFMALNQTVFKTVEILSSQVLELNVLLADKQEFLLLKYKLKAKNPHNNYSTFETAFKYKPNVEILSETNQLRQCEVGSNWDVKASRFRNYARSFGKTTKLGVILDVNFTHVTEVILNWIDPDNNIINSVKHTQKDIKNKQLAKVYIKENKTVLIKQSGIWTLKVVVVGAVLQKVKFAILPDINNSDYAELFNMKEKPVAIDLISPFYEIIDNCVISHSSSIVGSSILQQCHLTNWSSVAPDPKSVFNCPLY